MSAQGDLFDEAAARARDAALVVVEEHAAPDWLAVTERLIRRFPSGSTFTTDDVWRLLAFETAETHEPRALGAVVRKLAKLGVIVNTGTYEPSRRRECHARPSPGGG